MIDCKKIIAISAFLFAFICTADAQSLQAFKQNLACETISEAAPAPARVEVTEIGSAADVVRDLSNRNDKNARVRGYRVCIFFDNGQDARAGALAAKELFTTNFPDIKLYMVYENPYFRVTVGNCLTIEEAVILKGKLMSLFPKAFPKSEELALIDLLE